MYVCVYVDVYVCVCAHTCVHLHMYCGIPVEVRGQVVEAVSLLHMHRGE